MSQSEMDAIVVGFAWYRREEWEQWLKEVPDLDRWESCFEEWKRGASRTLRDLRRTGANVRKVEVRTAEFRAWCRVQNRAMDSQARAEYASVLVARASTA